MYFLFDRKKKVPKKESSPACLFRVKCFTLCRKRRVRPRATDLKQQAKSVTAGDLF